MKASLSFQIIFDVLIAISTYDRQLHWDYTYFPSSNLFNSKAEWENCARECNRYAENVHGISSDGLYIIWLRLIGFDSMQYAQKCSMFNWRHTFIARASTPHWDARENRSEWVIVRESDRLRAQEKYPSNLCVTCSKWNWNWCNVLPPMLLLLL